MARRGRPKGGDSAATRARVIYAARQAFVESGYDGASVADIAASADLAASAVYHYFGSKARLYEEIFDETSLAIWDQVDTVSTTMPTLLEGIQSIIDHTNNFGTERPYFSDFLALVPMETKLHPEFAHLLDLRRKHQDKTFGALAQLGISTGELDGFDVVEATEMLRSLIMGWFIERYFRGPGSDVRSSALVTLIRLLGERD